MVTSGKMNPASAGYDGRVAPDSPYRGFISSSFADPSSNTAEILQQTLRHPGNSNPVKASRWQYEHIVAGSCHY